jgi:hypothetical protein
MAPVQTFLTRALGHMARGSQSNPRSVSAAVEPLHDGDIATKVDVAVQRAGLLPTVQSLLWAAGWLYPCFMASTSLEPSLQHKAELACTACMYRATQLLFTFPPFDMAALLSLLRPCSYPQVSGEWVQCPDWSVAARDPGSSTCP